MENSGPVAEVVSLVCGTPANFNGFRVLAALGLLHGILVVGVSQTAALNRGRHRLVVNTESYRKPVCNMCYLSNYMLHKCLSV